MKIVQQGRRPNWFVGRKGRCSKCQAVVELESGDKPKETGVPIYIYFPCPECGTEIKIHFGDPPAWERDSAVK